MSRVKVVNIVKAKMRFKDKTETINYIITEFGEELLEPIFKPDVIDKIFEEGEKHYKEHPEDFVNINDL